jgi:hypothetical protein
MKKPLHVEILLRIKHGKKYNYQWKIIVKQQGFKNSFLKPLKIVF